MVIWTENAISHMKKVFEKEKKEETKKYLQNLIEIINELDKNPDGAMDLTDVLCNYRLKQFVFMRNMIIYTIKENNIIVLTAYELEIKED